ncbi:MAG: response regulator [Ignavibacteriaceae bacterium]|nr:response regulator [Ignavibacteriaceae bacterium]
MGSAKNILVVDDDPTVKALICHHLGKHGYLVNAASNPDEAFEILEHKTIDLVLCDVMMEGMDGYTFCQKVRTIDQYKVLPFVFVTSSGSLEDKARAMEVGGDDVITKPFEIEELLIKVQALLRRADIFRVYGAKKNLESAFAPKTAKILLVDDDPSLAKLFQYNLKKAGFDCIIASGPAEGFQMAKQEVPDIIISDIMMPEIDGFEFRRMLLNDDAVRTIPFVFLTSKGDEDDILNGYDLGITDYVLKTAGPRVVVAKVSAIIKSLGKERQKVVTELHQAADSLRVKVVPEKSPTFEGFDIQHWHQPFEGIPGGDFIDYFQIDENNLVIVLGDVMGKKWGAWYFAFAYAGYVRSAIRIVLQSTNDYSPSTILQQVNRSVYNDAKISEVFATLSIIIINKTEKSLKYAGAGDLPLIYKNQNTGAVSRLASQGLLLGFAAEGQFEDISINLSSGDLVIIATDGIIESRNQDNKQFGTERLNKIVENLLPHDDLILAIKDEFTHFTSGKFEDDISLITIKLN